LYIKKTKINTCEEVKEIENEIKSLIPISIVINNISVPDHCIIVIIIKQLTFI